MHQNKKVAVIIVDDPVREDLVKAGSTTILQQEQEDLVMELMGLKRGAAREQKRQEEEDDELREVNLRVDAGHFDEVSYGAKCIVIDSDLKAYEELGVSAGAHYKKEMWSQYDLVIYYARENQSGAIETVLGDLQGYKFNLLLIVKNISQEVGTEFHQEHPQPLPSRYQHKYQTLSPTPAQRQLALVHYSNYGMRVDRIETWEQINDQSSYIRRNSMRVNCLWREILTYLGRYPKYGA